MKRKYTYFALSLILVSGIASMLSCSGDPISGDISVIINPAAAYLDQTNASITTTQTVGGSDVSVLATVNNSAGSPYEMKNDQAIAVNGQSLTASATGTYARTIQPAAEYLVTVTEPSKFVKTTTIAPPSAFDITSPASNAVASLSGFTVTWSNPDPELTVEITLKQIINGSEKRRTFGPYTDTGTQSFSATDLAGDFFHGKDITMSITITKIREKTAINGFSNGKLVAKLFNTLVVTPGP